MQHQSPLKQRTPTPASSANTDLVYLYGYMLGMLQYEGGGIWNRFNIMFSVNALLFGVASFVFAGKPTHWQPFLIGVSCLGVLLSLWSAHVLRKLWIWHRHWKTVLEDIEKGFPIAPGWTRAISTRPHALRHKEYWFSTWLVKYTQPFFLILCAVWIFLIVLTAAYETPIDKKQTGYSPPLGALSPHTDSKKHTLTPLAPYETNTAKNHHGEVTTTAESTSTATNAAKSGETAPKRDVRSSTARRQE